MEAVAIRGKRTKKLVSLPGPPPANDAQTGSNEETDTCDTSDPFTDCPDKDLDGTVTDSDLESSQSFLQQMQQHQQNI